MHCQKWCVTFDCIVQLGFQVFNDFRLMTKPVNSVKPNLSLYSTKVSYFLIITCTILKACQDHHGYVVNVNVKVHDLW